MKPNYRDHYVEIFFNDPSDSPSLADTLTGYVTEQIPAGIIVANDEHGTDADLVPWDIIARVKTMTDDEFGKLGPV